MANKTLQQLHEELLANPGVRDAYEEQAAEFASARAIIAGRVRPQPKAGRCWNARPDPAGLRACQT